MIFARSRVFRISFRLVATCLPILFAAEVATAEHAKITLEVKALKSGRSATAFVDQTPGDSGKNPRPVLKVQAGETLKIQWSFTNVYPHKTLEDALLYFYVAPIEKVGQKDLPDLSDQKAIVESGFEMDLKPNRKAGQRQTLRIDAPGVYLVRIESRRTQSDHEHFAAIDLVVEPAPKGD